MCSTRVCPGENESAQENRSTKDGFVFFSVLGVVIELALSSLESHVDQLQPLSVSTLSAARSTLETDKKSESLAGQNGLQSELHIFPPLATHEPNSWTPYENSRNLLCCRSRHKTNTTFHHYRQFPPSTRPYRLWLRGGISVDTRPTKPSHALNIFPDSPFLERGYQAKKIICLIVQDLR